MTRINVVPVQELTREHLVAEYREIARMPNSLRRTLDRKSGKPFKFDEVPTRYTLGKGHMKFFFNKFSYLKLRFEQLVEEMGRRGYNCTYRDSSIFEVGELYMGDYAPTREALAINRERIAERLKGRK